MRAPGRTARRRPSRSPPRPRPTCFVVPYPASQSFVVADRRAEDLWSSGRPAGLAAIEVGADEVHLAEVVPAEIEGRERVRRRRIRVPRERATEAGIRANNSRWNDERRGEKAVPAGCGECFRRHAFGLRRRRRADEYGHYSQSEKRADRS